MKKIIGLVLMAAALNLAACASMSKSCCSGDHGCKDGSCKTGHCDLDKKTEPSK